MMAQPAKRNRMVLQQHRQKNKPNSLTMVQSQEQNNWVNNGTNTRINQMVEQWQNHIQQIV